jgi:hypothetical protein
VHVVAILEPPAAPPDIEGMALPEGVTALDVRLASPATTPSLVLRTPSRDRGDEVARALVSLGLRAVSLDLADVVPVARMVHVHRVAFDPSGLRAEVAGPLLAHDALGALVRVSASTSVWRARLHAAAVFTSVGLLAACGGTSASPPNAGIAGDASTADAGPASDAAGEAPPDATGTTPLDGAAGSDAAATTGSVYFTTNIPLEPGLCLPQAFAVDDAGQISCTILFVLAAGDSCEAHPGLVAAPADVVASVRVLGDVDASHELCVLPQLPTSDWVDGSCATSSEVGWCYLAGAAAGGCSQTIATSSSATVPSGDYAILICGGAASSVAPGGAGAPVGTPCVPQQELQPTFAGFNEHEVTLDPGDPVCGPNVCLVNHFQGLTDCPYGQDPLGASPGPKGTPACTVPGTSTPVNPTSADSASAGESVAGQCADRRAKGTVYCSCRCANAQGTRADDATYCACPSGYTCTPLVSAIGANDPVAGSYCIASGTAYAYPPPSCDECGAAVDCP